MKKYTVNVHADFVCTIEVYANSKAEAIDLAREQSENEEFEYCSFSDACIIDVENK